MSDISITVNGQREPLVDSTLADLLARHGIEPQAPGIAVAVNGSVLPRVRWTDAPVNAGDRIEIVQARQGG